MTTKSEISRNSYRNPCKTAWKLSAQWWYLENRVKLFVRNSQKTSGRYRTFHYKKYHHQELSSGQKKCFKKIFIFCPLLKRFLFLPSSNFALKTRVYLCFGGWSWPKSLEKSSKNKNLPKTFFLATGKFLVMLFFVVECSIAIWAFLWIAHKRFYAVWTVPAFCIKGYGGILVWISWNFRFCCHF